MDSYKDPAPMDDDMDDHDVDNIDNPDGAEIQDEEHQEKTNTPARVTTPFLTKYERGLYSIYLSFLPAFLG